MKTLDRYVIRNFLFSVGLWFVVMMALRIVADLFVNMDEFTEHRMGVDKTLELIFYYYRYHALMYFIELGGISIVAGATFSLARMNQTNELTAMLASGVNLHRIILPIVILAAMMDALVILDQELLIPSCAVQLAAKRGGKEETREGPVGPLSDSEGSIWRAARFEPRQQRMENPVVVIRADLARPQAGGRPQAGRRPEAGLSGASATPAVLRGVPGWMFERPMITRILRTGVPWAHTPDYRRIWTRVGPTELLEEARRVVQERTGRPVPPGDRIPYVEFVAPLGDAHYQLVLRADRLDLTDPIAPGQPRGGKLTQARFAFSTEAGKSLGTFVADSATWHPGEPGRQGWWQLTNGRLFYPSDLTGNYIILRQSRRWINYMSTAKLTELLREKRVVTPQAILTKHTRFTEPLNNIIMLLLSVPFIVSRERTIKASASRCLLASGAFYVFVYGCRYAGLPPEWAAWLPILVFGPISVVMLDSVKT